jgi:L-asparaginase
VPLDLSGSTRALRTETGMTVREACAEAMRDLAELKGGFLGAVVVHAIDRHGNPCVLANRPIPGGHDRYFYWQEGMDAPDLRTAEQFRA